MVLLLFFVLLWTCPGSPSKTETSIKCVIINLEYINCTWAEDGIPQEDYRFTSRFETSSGGSESECSTYIKARNVSVGCVVPYSEEGLQRFDNLHAWLYSSNGTVVAEHNRKLKEMVKLNPPSNLAVEMRHPELWLYWNSTNKTKQMCKESEVRYRINHKDWQSHKINTEINSFSLPFPNSRSRYEFGVRVRMSSVCGESQNWSEWSESVWWGSIKETNDTVTETGRGMPVALMVLYTAGAAVALIVLSCLLVRSERLRVILVPVVPNPPKHLVDLIENYKGNVEEWLSLPKELQDGFKPNFTERTCPVREYRLVSQSSSDSENSLSGLTDVSSDYQPMHSYSSTSTLPAPAETTQAPPPAGTRAP